MKIMETFENINEVCRLCLGRDLVDVSIFNGLTNASVSAKIDVCLPVKVSPEDTLPKRICSDCSYKLDQQFDFWNTSLNSDKKLREFLGVTDVTPVKSTRIKKERKDLDNDSPPPKKARRAPKRKVAASGRQSTVAAAPSASDDEDNMNLSEIKAKKEQESDNDFDNNDDDYEPKPDEDDSTAGPSGLQKDEEENDTGKPLVEIKEETTDHNEDSRTFDSSLSAIYVHIKPECSMSSNPNDAQKDWPKRQAESKTKCAEADKNDIENIFYQSNTSPVNSCAYKLKSSPNKRKRQKLKGNAVRNTKVTCVKCSKVLADKFKLRRHVRGLHKEFYPEFMENLRLERERLANITPTCQECGRTYTTKGNLNNHLKMAHDPHFQRPRYTCDQCGRVYSNRSTFYHHKVGHTGFVCETCGKNFKCKDFLKMHVRIHTGEKPFKCDSCEKCFSKLEYLRIHVRTHTKEKPYACGVCGKKYSQRSSLSVHKLTHTGQKPHQCSFCPEKFSIKTLLKTHQAKNHNILGIEDLKTGHPLG